MSPDETNPQEVPSTVLPEQDHTGPGDKAGQSWIRLEQKLEESEAKGLFDAHFVARQSTDQPRSESESKLFADAPSGRGSQDAGQDEAGPSCLVEKLTDRNRRLFSKPFEIAFTSVRGHLPQPPTRDLSIIFSRDVRLAGAMVAGWLGDDANDCYWMGPHEKFDELAPIWPSLLTAITDSIASVGRTSVLVVATPSRYCTHLETAKLRAWAQAQKLRLVLVLEENGDAELISREKLSPAVKDWPEPEFLEAYADALRDGVARNASGESLAGQINRGLWGEGDIREVLDLLQADIKSFDDVFSERCDETSRSTRAKEFETLFNDRVTRCSPAHAISLFFAGYFPDIREHAFFRLANRIIARLSVGNEQTVAPAVDDAVLQECRLAVRQPHGQSATLQPRDGRWVRAEIRRLFVHQGRLARRQVLSALLLVDPLTVLGVSERRGLAKIIADEIVAGDLINKPEGADLVATAAFGAPALGGTLATENCIAGSALADARAARVSLLVELASVIGGSDIASFIFDALLSLYRPEGSDRQGYLAADCARTVIDMVFAAPNFGIAKAWGRDACRTLARAGSAAHLHAALDEIGHGALAGRPAVAGALAGFAEAGRQLATSAATTRLGQDAFCSLQLRLFSAPRQRDGRSCDPASMMSDLTEDEASTLREDVVRLSLNPSFRQRFHDVYGQRVRAAVETAATQHHGEPAQALGILPEQVWAGLELRATVFGLVSALFGPGNVTFASETFGVWLEDVMDVPPELRAAMPSLEKLLWLRDHPLRADEDARAAFKPADEIIDAFVASGPLLIAAASQLGRDGTPIVDASYLLQVHERNSARDTRDFVGVARRTLLNEAARAASAIRYTLRGEPRAGAIRHLQEMKDRVNALATAIKNAAAPAQ